ncbi:hypothetical protein [Planomonospora sp. ID82291]|uniref:hypothetical protein n=1 Tax=Planomonospora sp. ID82291 TaxID=2738136 RepID=UPI0018C41A05|nr:hypothetical protein [Planomonospora sp. ID82291]MBG0813334.1 hypothetical protein [Planomonospora sp. ID82291]
MRNHQRLGYGVAALLLASAAFHLAVYAVDGGGWAGPVSWRKPILFGFSFGVTLASLVWVIGRLELPDSRARWLVGVLGVSSVAEVGLITAQRWRGVPSHLNFGTTVDAAVSALLAGFAILGLIPSIVVVTVLAFRRLDGPPSMRLAVRAGMGILVLSQFAGAALIANGRVIGLPPEATDLSIFGTAGQLKVPHAVTLHAVQVLPILAALLTLTAWSERARTGLVALATGGYGGLVLVGVVQAAQGLAPIDLTATSGALLVVSAAALLAAGAAALSRLRFAALRPHRLPS